VTWERRAPRIIDGVDEPRTVDAVCVVRLWMERGDPVLRGRVESTLDEGTVTARGVDELTGAVRAQLDHIEQALARAASGGG
jgi:hypothetical protein